MLARRLVLEPLLVGQVDVEGLDPVVGQELAAELGDLAAVDDRADQVVEPRSGRCRRVRGSRSGRAGTARSHRWPPGRRSGRAGGGTRRRRSGRTGCPAAPCSDRPSRRSSPSAAGCRSSRRRAGRPRWRSSAQLVVPLVHQVDRRRDDQGRPRSAFSIARLARCVLPVPVGRTTTPVPAVLPPRLEPFGLVRERLLLDPERPFRCIS